MQQQYISTVVVGKSNLSLQPLVVPVVTVQVK